MWNEFRAEFALVGKFWFWSGVAVASLVWSGAWYLMKAIQ